MFGRDHKIERLEQIPGLDRCPLSELRLIASSGDMATLEPGDVLRRSGSSDRSYFLVLEGEVRVNGNEQRLRPGDGFGAAGLLTNTIEPDELRMSSRGNVLIVDVRHFEGLIRRSPAFARTIAADLARRFQSSR